MTTLSNQVAVDGTAVLLVPAAPQYQEVSVHSTQPIFIGDSTVTSTTGYKVDKDLNFTYTLAPHVESWSIANGVPATVYTLVTVL